MIVGFLPAFGSLAYKGVLFSTSSQPGWKDARWMGGFMANSALMLGCAEMLAVSVLTGHLKAADSLRTVLMLLLPLNIIPAGLLFAESHKTLLRLYRDRQVYLASVLLFVGGTLIPLVLLLMGDSVPGILGVALLILLDVRFVIQPPASTALDKLRGLWDLVDVVTENNLIRAIVTWMSPMPFPFAEIVALTDLQRVNWKVWFERAPLLRPWSFAAG